MLSDGSEHPCETIDVSVTGLAINAYIVGDFKERVVAYIDELGRLEGVVARRGNGWFAIDVKIPQSRIDRLAQKIAALGGDAGASTSGAPELQMRSAELEPSSGRLSPSVFAIRPASAPEFKPISSCFRARASPSTSARPSSPMTPPTALSSTLSSVRRQRPTAAAALSRRGAARAFERRGGRTEAGAGPRGAKPIFLSTEVGHPASDDFAQRLRRLRVVLYHRVKIAIGAAALTARGRPLPSAMGEFA